MPVYPFYASNLSAPVNHVLHYPVLCGCFRGRQYIGTERLGGQAGLASTHRGRARLALRLYTAEGRATGR